MCAFCKESLGVTRMCAFCKESLGMTDGVSLVTYRVGI